MLITQDFRPLCNEHYTGMVERSLVIHPVGTASEAEIPVWGCARQGCARHYDFNFGYHDLTPSGSLHGKYDNSYTCDEHQVKLYVQSYNPQSNVEVWRCPTRDCTRSERVCVAA